MVTAENQKRDDGGRGAGVRGKTPRISTGYVATDAATTAPMVAAILGVLIMENDMVGFCERELENNVNS